MTLLESQETRQSIYFFLFYFYYFPLSFFLIIKTVKDLRFHILKLLVLIFLLQVSPQQAIKCLKDHDVTFCHLALFLHVSLMVVPFLSSL